MTVDYLQGPSTTFKGPSTTFSDRPLPSGTVHYLQRPTTNRVIIQRCCPPTPITVHHPDRPSAAPAHHSRPSRTVIYLYRNRKEENNEEL
ncbi:hypothetical protein BV898_09420 [Hypsibius exemplaris]|uniref:Uncharacterized protein n=1 Tax=Hypsibius exemplaris TaxID=2072580 RepID=A0A1W0WML1_HYPEX|nr:hypothetical protein BV898_09420 [Hypsibius exemplaris]